MPPLREKSRGFRLARRGVIVGSVRALLETRGRLVVAILSLALLYASVCPTTCAMSFGSSAAQPADNPGCDHASSHMPVAPSDNSTGTSHRQAPEKPGCFGHHHSAFNIVKGDGSLQFQLRAVGHAHASDLSANAANAMAFSLVSASVLDLTPPQSAPSLLHQKISVLRI